MCNCSIGMPRNVRFASTLDSYGTTPGVRASSKRIAVTMFAHTTVAPIVHTH
jgi:hypothetical protein